MIITISGMPGSGKTTVGKMLAKRLGWKFYSVGDLRGKVASEMGITIDELNEIGKKEFWTDQKADELTKKLGEAEDDFVIDGRLAFRFIPHSFKVFLSADLKKSALRIFRDQRGDEKKAGSEKEVLDSIRKRLDEDDGRYKRYYGIDFLNKKNYDLVIDTTEMRPEEVASAILKAMKKK